MIYIPGKIPIRIHPIFWLFAVLISALGSASILQFFCWLTVIVVSVLVHEMGHALTALAFGQVAQIDLVAFGGLTRRHGRKLSRWQEFLIVFNGPLAGFLLAIVSYFFLSGPIFFPPWVDSILYMFMAANIFWTIINLIPVQPLDGGHLLRIPLEALFGLKGLKIALLISLVVSVAAAIFCFVSGQMLAGALFMMLMFENYKAWKSSLEIAADDDDQSLQQEFKQAQRHYQEGNEAEAIQGLEKIRQRAPVGVLSTASTVLLARIFDKQNKDEQAFNLLYPLKKKLAPGDLQFLQEAAIHSNRWNEAIEIGAIVYQNHPHYETAVINAICCARLKNVSQAVGWLNCAVKDGLPNLEEILKLSEFDSIRREPAFQELH